MTGSATAVALKFGSYFSIGLGPLLSTSIPMASDLRRWAFWFSAVVSIATLVWLTVRFSDAAARQWAHRDLFICCAAAVVFAFAYIAINLFWTVERGDFTDTLWQLGLVGTFGLAVGSITAALAAGEKAASSGGR